MDMSNSSNPSMSSMAFQSSPNTPLYSSSWTPTSPGGYAGTCIFLVVLALAARLLVALRTRQEARWLDRDLDRRYVVVPGDSETLAERISNDPLAKRMTVALSAKGAEDNVVVVSRSGHPSRPWRFSVDPVRAALDTLIVAVGYLLMLAVMTMNVGYFLSVLAGVFIGSLAVGRYSHVPEH